MQIGHWRHGVCLIIAGFSLTLAAAESLSDHEDFCQQNPQAPCLVYIQQSLALLPEHSAGWYKIKSYELDYYFDTRSFETLFGQTSALLQHPSLPDVFLLQLYFYHAKTLIAFKRPDEAKHYANQAVTKLESVFSNFGTPLRLVELANLYYSLKDPTQAFKLLALAEQQYSKNRDPLFWYELYSNQALIKHQWDDLASAETLRAKALEAALSIGHKGKLIVSYGNLARTQQLRGQYTQAYNNYLQSLNYFSAGEDDNTYAIYQLRLAQISWQAGQYAQAVKHLQLVEADRLGNYHQLLYHQLSTSNELSPLLLPVDKRSPRG